MNTSQLANENIFFLLSDMSKINAAHHADNKIQAGEVKKEWHNVTTSTKWWRFKDKSLHIFVSMKTIFSYQSIVFTGDLQTELLQCGHVNQCDANWYLTYLWFNACVFYALYTTGQGFLQAEE